MDDEAEAFFSWFLKRSTVSPKSWLISINSLIKLPGNPSLTNWLHRALKSFLLIISNCSERVGVMLDFWLYNLFFRLFPESVGMTKKKTNTNRIEPKQGLKKSVVFIWKGSLALLKLAFFDQMEWNKKSPNTEFKH